MYPTSRALKEIHVNQVENRQPFKISIGSDNKRLGATTLNKIIPVPVPIVETSAWNTSNTSISSKPGIHEVPKRLCSVYENITEFYIRRMERITLQAVFMGWKLYNAEQRILVKKVYAINYILVQFIVLRSNMYFNKAIESITTPKKRRVEGVLFRIPEGIDELLGREEYLSMPKHPNTARLSADVNPSTPKSVKRTHVRATYRGNGNDTSSSSAPYIPLDIRVDPAEGIHSGTENTANIPTKTSTSATSTSLNEPTPQERTRSDDITMSSMLDRLKSIEGYLHNIQGKAPSSLPGSNEGQSSTNAPRGFEFYTESLLDENLPNHKRRYNTHDEFHSSIHSASKGAMKHLLRDCSGSGNILNQFMNTTRDVKPLGIDNAMVELTSLSLLQEKMTGWRQSYSTKKDVEGSNPEK